MVRDKLKRPCCDDTLGCAADAMPFNYVWWVSSLEMGLELHVRSGEPEQ